MQVNKKKDDLRTPDATIPPIKFPNRFEKDMNLIFICLFRRLLDNLFRMGRSTVLNVCVQYASGLELRRGTVSLLFMFSSFNAELTVPNEHPQPTHIRKFRRIKF